MRVFIVTKFAKKIGIKRGDAVILSALLLLCLTLFVISVIPEGKPGELRAVVRRAGEIVAELPLSRDCTYEMEEFNIVVSDRKAHVNAAKCPDKLCEGMGEIGQAGESVVCLPNRISVSVEGGGGNGLDALSR